jgi:hypothetical protein
MASPKGSTKTNAKNAAAKTTVPAKPVLSTQAKVAVKAKPPRKVETTAKPAAKRPVAGKAVAKAPAKAVSGKPATVAAKQPKLVSSEQRRYYVEVAAYHIAERRGFAPGNPLDDWIQAEAEIDRLLAAGLLGS